MLKQDLTALEALGIAIRCEIDAQQVYKDLSEMTENDLLKVRFLNLYHEEKKHQKILENMYHEMFPYTELIIPESQLPKSLSDSQDRKKMKIADILQLAVDEEKRSREFYLDCAESIGDFSGKRMFRFLADFEFSHQMMANAELEMLNKYPSYFNSGESWNPESGLNT